MTSPRRSTRRDAFLRELLRHFAGNGTAGLQEMMRTGTPALAANAAALLLHGHDFGAWRARPRDLKLARTLARKSKPTAQLKREAKPIAKPLQPLTWDDLEAPAKPKIANKGKPFKQVKAELEPLFALQRAGNEMRAILAEPGASDRHLAAIQLYFATAELAGLGDDLRELLAKDRIAKGNRQ